MTLSWRTAWIARAWARDTTTITRWFRLTTTAHSGEAREILWDRILGWDSSTPPEWLAPSRIGRIVNTLEELPMATVESLVCANPDTSAESQILEVRRVEPPVTDWYGGISAELLGLSLPLTLYEVWVSAPAYERARTLWNQLNGEERATAGLADGTLGYLSSRLVLIPRRRPFFVDTEKLIIPAVDNGDQSLVLISEVLDGTTVIARTAAPLRTEPCRELNAEERLRYLSVRRSGQDFAAMNAARDARPCQLAEYPADAHGKSGSDWRLTLLDPSGFCDAAAVGLIRGLGSGSFTHEPWATRSPGLGFSAPARVEYVPPGANAFTSAVASLRRAGGPASLCDPYAEPQDLMPLGDVLRRGRVITRAKNAAAILAWAHDHDVTVRSVPSLHDRFIIGPKRAFLLGSSLNGLGRAHAFLVELDNVMRADVQRTFEALWANGTAPGEL